MIRCHLQLPRIVPTKSVFNLAARSRCRQQSLFESSVRRLTSSSPARLGPLFFWVLFFVPMGSRSPFLLGAFLRCAKSSKKSKISRVTLLLSQFFCKEFCFPRSVFTNHPEIFTWALCASPFHGCLCFMFRGCLPACSHAVCASPFHGCLRDDEP